MKDSSINFSGHETFPFRYAWLKKGVDAVLRNPAFFSSERAMIELGVGKNMVRSIRHWCLATRLLEEKHSDSVPTDIGKSIFADEGLDPYLEDPATLWLLHWQLVATPDRATTWHWVFSYWHAVEFTKDQLVSSLVSALENNRHKRISENTLRRDVECFVRTYVHSRQTKSAILEDTLDCPLVDLRLITELPDGKTYQFQRGKQPSLPDEVFVYALIEFWNRHSIGIAHTLAFERIAYDPGSPGRVFKLDEDSLAGRLERIEDITNGGFRYGDTAGLKQVYRNSGKGISALELLKLYYDSNSMRSRSQVEK